MAKDLTPVPSPKGEGCLLARSTPTSQNEIVLSSINVK